MTSLISRFIVVIAFSLGLASCHVSPKVPGELGNQFTATIPGTWSGEFSGNGVRCTMIKQFSADGSARGVLMLKQTQGSVSLVMPEIPFTSRWRVKGDTVETYDVTAGIPGLFKKGDVIYDELISVSSRRIVYRSKDSGKVEFITRLNALGG